MPEPQIVPKIRRCTQNECFISRKLVGLERTPPHFPENKPLVLRIPLFAVIRNIEPLSFFFFRGAQADRFFN